MSTQTNVLPDTNIFGTDVISPLLCHGNTYSMYQELLCVLSMEYFMQASKQLYKFVTAHLHVADKEDLNNLSEAHRWTWLQTVYLQCVDA